MERFVCEVKTDFVQHPWGLSIHMKKQKNNNSSLC